MTDRLMAFLARLATTRGQSYYQPQSGNENDLTNFQFEIDEIKRLQAEGILEIIGKPHRESMSGHGFVDLIKLELTANGVVWVADRQSEKDIIDDQHLRRLIKIVTAAKASEDNLVDLSQVLREEGLTEKEVWNESNYMEGERWLTIEVDEAPIARLTHEGIKFAEAHASARAQFHTHATSSPGEAGERQLRIFLCHSSNDKPSVRALYNALRLNKGIEPWLDEIDLLPGQDWDLEIRKAVKRADVVIVCLSQSSVSKRGYLQKEIKYALDVASEQPDGAIFLIPLRFEECTVPDRLSDRQWVDYFAPNGQEQLMRALRVRSKHIASAI